MISTAKKIVLLVALCSCIPALASAQTGVNADRCYTDQEIEEGLQNMHITSMRAQNAWALYQAGQITFDEYQEAVDAANEAIREAALRNNNAC